jgi:two-component system chemotaxis response regulator CheB
MFGHDIITIGASAGGVEALVALIRGMPSDLPAAVFVVLHIPADVPSYLPTILDRAGPLPAGSALDGQAIAPGRIYVAPPGRHLILERGTMRLIWGATENRHRPAVDPLMRSAAIAYGPRVIGVILSGGDGDGTAGLRAIKRRGGFAVVQDPDGALFPGMPQSAISYVDVDHRLPVAEIGPLLAQLARAPAEDETAYPVPEELILEQQQMTEAPGTTNLSRYGMPSSFTCPECSGPLWELRDGELIRYRCRVGHAFIASDMIDARSQQLEQTLWSTLNQLEESVLLSSKLASDAHARGYSRAAASFQEKADRARHRSELIRQALESEGSSRISEQLQTEQISGPNDET